MITTASLITMLGTSLTPGLAAGLASWLAGRSRSRQFDEELDVEVANAQFSSWLRDYNARAWLIELENERVDKTVELKLFKTVAFEDVATVEMPVRVINVRATRMQRDELASCETFAVNRMMDKSISDDSKLTALRVAELCAAVRHSGY